MRTLLCRGQEDLLWAPPPELLDQGLTGQYCPGMLAR